MPLDAAGFTALYPQMAGVIGANLSTYLANALTWVNAKLATFTGTPVEADKNQAQACYAIYLWCIDRKTALGADAIKSAQDGSVQGERDISAALRSLGQDIEMWLGLAEKFLQAAKANTVTCVAKKAGVAR